MKAYTHTHTRTRTHTPTCRPRHRYIRTQRRLSIDEYLKYTRVLIKKETSFYKFVLVKRRGSTHILFDFSPFQMKHKISFDSAKQVLSYFNLPLK